MILITGGAGYIGSHFARAYLLQNPGVEVVVVDSLAEGHPEALSSMAGIHFVQENIGNLQAMKALFGDYPIDMVVHFAASCYVGESQKNPSKYFHNNVINTLNLLKAMDDCGVSKMVFSSSCATYGYPVSIPIDENHPQNPVNIYGLTKLMIEQALAGYAKTRGWSYIALRYFNAAGADEGGLLGEHHEPETHLIPLILQAAQDPQKAIHVYGTDYETPDGTCIRDYIHVTDLAMAHMQALQKLESFTGGKALNLGTTHGTSVKTVIDRCREITGCDIAVREAPRRDGDPPLLVAKADEASSFLGWFPQYDLDQIIQTAWQWEQHRKF
jgi:UDP-glucose 4-epimerase